jgi:hypothetical protein
MIPQAHRSNVTMSEILCYFQGAQAGHFDSSELNLGAKFMHHFLQHLTQETPSPSLVKIHSRWHHRQAVGLTVQYLLECFARVGSCVKFPWGRDDSRGACTTDSWLFRAEFSHIVCIIPPHHSHSNFYPFHVLVDDRTYIQVGSFADPADDILTSIFRLLISNCEFGKMVHVLPNQTHFGMYSIRQYVLESNW